MDGTTKVITGIVESTRKEGRYVVAVDGRPAHTVSLDIIDQLKLRVGGAVDAAGEAALEGAAAALQTYDRALNLLAFQARSARDLRRRLVQKGEPAEHVDRAIERLTAQGLLDDAQFARQLARSKVASQGASRRRLQQEMFKRGVAREVADEAIAEVYEDEQVDEGVLVEEVARKRVRSLAKLDPEARRRRLYAFLARRGYEGEAIRRAMRAVLDAEEGREAADAIDGE
jgi:regulatory protein